MESTKSFKNTILNHLRERAFREPLFKVKLENPKKNIKDCVTYILNQVKNSGCNGFEDDEIFNMAVHYYDEEDINIGSSFGARVVVNHIPVISEEEKAQAKEKAIQELIAEEKARMTKKRTKKAPNKTNEKEIVKPTNTLF